MSQILKSCLQSSWRIAIALICALSVLVPMGRTVFADDESLTVCLEEDSPPYSYKFKSRKGGFDLALSEAVAAQLGRTLQIQWFESENDDENIPAWEANALLSDGLCDLVAGYPLVQANLVRPKSKTGALPEYDGMKRSERGRLVEMGTVRASLPYHRSGFAVILARDVPITGIKRLRELSGLRIAAEVSTLSSALLFRNGGGFLVADLNHVPPTKDLLGQLEAGRFDAAMIELHRFDWYRQRNPETGLKFSGYLHPLGVNMGFIGLDNRSVLIDTVNAALGALSADGTIANLAKQAGMSFVPPAEPAVLQKIMPGMLDSG